MRLAVSALAFLAATAPALGATARGDAGGAPSYVAADAGAPLAGVALVVRAGVDRETPAQNGLAALVAESILRGDAGGRPLRDAIVARGGDLSYTVGTGSVRFYLEAPPSALPALAPLVARAIARPAFDAATVSAARGAVGERIDEQQKNPILVGLEAVRNAYYRDAAGLPALGTKAALAGLDPAALRAFHDRWYVRGDAFVVAVGHTGVETDAAGRALVAALPAGTAPVAPRLATKPFAAKPRRIVTRRDVFAPYVVAGFAAPALGDPDFATVLVVRSFLAQIFEVPSATTLPGVRRAIGAIYGYDVAPAQLAVWINGARLDPTSGLTLLDRVIAGASARPLSEAVLQRYKTSAHGEWLLESLSLDDRSAAIANAVALGLDPDVAARVAQRIDAVTPADVERAVKKWFAKYDVALVLPRGGEGG